MTNDEIRIAIAEACGLDTTPVQKWAFCYTFPTGANWIKSGGWRSKDAAEHEGSKLKSQGYTVGDVVEDGLECADIPNYPDDLNAMHEAEKVLSPSQVKDYLNHLGYLTPFENANGKGTWPVVCATITQRREAFLRTINKWKD